VDTQRLKEPRPLMASARSVVVMSRDAAHRQGWSRELAREGVRVVRCAGRDCPLLRGEPCEILAKASFAVYDEESVTPELFLALVRARGRPTVLFARDSSFDGRHRARFVRVLDQRGAATVYPHLR
jgi:hypothetical protein